MASEAVNVLAGQGGFVATADLYNEVAGSVAVAAIAAVVVQHQLLLLLEMVLRARGQQGVLGP